MGNSHAGLLRTTRFDEVLHNYIETSLRSSTAVPRPVFAQLYLEAEQPLSDGRMENDEEDDDEDCSETASPPIPYLMKSPPKGCCTTDGFCQAGGDLRLSSLGSDPLEVPPGFTLVGVKSPSLPETLLVCAVDCRFLPDERGRHALLGFSGNCIGCGEKGFQYFTEFSLHINLKLSSQPMKQKHLKYHLYRNNQGVLVRGAPVCWRAHDGRVKVRGSSPARRQVTSEQHTPNKVAHPPVSAGAESNAAPQTTDAAHMLTNGNHVAPLSGPGRPPTAGALAGPPKKRHKGWSPDSHQDTVKSPPSSSAASLHPAPPIRPAESGTPVCSSQGCPQGPPVTVPDQLLHSCGLQPVVFTGHGALPQLTGNVKDVLVSSLLQTCYMSSQTLPRFYQHYGPSPIQPLSTEMQILLTVYYLVQLGPDQVPLIEDLEQIFMRSWRESHLSEIRQYQQPQTQGRHFAVENSGVLPGLPRHPSFSPHSQLAVTPTQLPWLAQLAVSSSGDGVRVLAEQKGTLAKALQQTFHQLKDGHFSNTSYIIIIATPPGQETQSCVVVTGKHQCRALAEGMFSPSDSLQEISRQLSTAAAQELIHCCSSLGQDGDFDSLLDDALVNSRDSSSSSSPASSQEKSLKHTSSHRRPASPKPRDSCPGIRASVARVWPEVDARAYEVQLCLLAEYSVQWQEVRPIQLAVARKLLSHVCAIADSSTQNLDLGSFDRVSFLILVPPSEVTFQQTVLQLCTSGVLQELGSVDQDRGSQQDAEQYVVKMDVRARARIDGFIQEASSNSYTLHILVHDHAHWDISSGSYSGSDNSIGLVDQLLNSRQVKDAPNILILHVTSFPFALQTQCTRISPYNEIHWPSSFSNDVDLYHEKTLYFGVSELLESTRLGVGLPLMRCDSSFEQMVSSLEEKYERQTCQQRDTAVNNGFSSRFPELHSTVIRTTLLIQHYCVALMAVSGRVSDSHNLQKHTSVETLEMVQALLIAAQQCPAHHGHMLLLRIPSSAMAAWAHRRLSRVRRQLGLEDTFEIILGNPGHALSVSASFTDQIKVWLKIQDAGWVPRTYLELEALPCILILSGAEPLGESLPRSLKYCDLRVISCSYLHRTTLEQELGLAAYLVRAESRARDNCGPGSDVLDSDGEKLSSTDNEEEEMHETGESPLSSGQVQQSCPNSAGSSCFAAHATPPTYSDTTQTASPNQNRLSALDHPPPALHKRTVLQNQALLQDHRQTAQPRLRQSKSPSSDCSSGASSPSQTCSWARGVIRPPSVLLPRSLYDIITASDGSGLPRCTSFLPHMSVAWASSFRPLLSKMMTCTEQSLYYRQWTVPQSHHMDSNNRTEGRSDNFHPRRLLLSGPPQVGKTGAYLHFLGILSRMLIRLMEVDIYNEEDININSASEEVFFNPVNLPWPNADVLKSAPFDYTIHDPKYDDISAVYCPGFRPGPSGTLSRVVLCGSEVKAVNSPAPRQEDVYLRRRTTRIKLSKYAAYNTYHHCEQCHQYLGFNPRYQMHESTLHAFSFTHLLLGEEVQLFFIIPRSKEHYFRFSHPGGRLESMRLPLTSDLSTDRIKTPIFTPTTGRHEHGLFNLFHAMDGAAHLHILVVKEYEMAIYKKYWPNHIMLVLPAIFNGAGIGAAHFLIKELSHHNLELERSRRVEGCGPAAEVWPFIVVADDSCVMWNAVDVDPSSGAAERAVSLKQVLQHMERCPDLTHYGLCGLRKWSSWGLSGLKQADSFSRGHLHDFVLLNVDRCQNVQYGQNRFTCHDVDFALRLHSTGLLVCRFNRFSVMKKQIPIGGFRTFVIKTKVTDVPTSVGPPQYVCAPDSKHLFLATPAQLLLEKYLQNTGHKLFPLGASNYSHPVLSVDCYLNLGPEVTVCFVSSRPHSINISTTGLLFSGLLLCFPDSFVTPCFLKRFSFIKGATLCVISADRSSLRQTVVRLELEEEWRFRLSDEFQTANAKEDRPIFFLTGRHI
ncbi:LOW QUALITY PROTEIN: protein GREB1 [Neosynchiropus ocellatus]